MTENVSARATARIPHDRSPRPIASLLRALCSLPAAVGIIGLVFVTAFVNVVPSGFGLDEEHHTYRAWQVSRGVLTPDTLEQGIQYGGKIPAPIVDYVIEGTDAANAGRGTGLPWQRQDISLAPDLEFFGSIKLTQSTPLRTEEFTNAAASTFVPYLPAALGMRIGTVLDLDVAGIVWFGKIFSGLSYVTLITAAVLIARRSRWRWLIAIVGLLPLSLFQAAVISADTFSNGIAILFVASILALRDASPPSSRGAAVVALLAGLGLVLAKPTYLLLLPLLFAVPSRALGLSKKLGSLTKAAAVGVLGTIGAVTSAQASNIAGAIRYQVPNWPTVDQTAQLSAILQRPIDYVVVIGRTFVEFGSSWVEGTLAMFGTNIVYLPEPFIILLIGAIVLATFYGGERSWRTGTLFSVTAVVTVVAVITALYLTFTPVGAATSNGVQGRYWIPLLLPALAGVGMLLPVSVSMSERTAAAIFMGSTVLTLAMSLFVWCWVVY